MTSSLFSIIFVTLIGVSPVQSMVNEPITARSFEVYIDGVITGKQAVKGWVSPADVQVLTQTIAQYQVSPVSLLNMNDEARQNFLTTADRVTTLLSGNTNQEIKHWANEVNRAKDIFQYFWNTQPAVQPLGEVVLPEQARQRAAFKAVYYAQPEDVKEISHEVPASPEQIENFKKVFFQPNTQVAPLHEEWFL